MSRTLISKVSRKIRKSNIPFFGLNKTRVVFLCPADFHYFHISPVVEKLACENDFEVTIVKWEAFNQEAINDVRYIDVENFEDEYLRTYDIFFTTEFNRAPPWWMTGILKVYFLHGVGPKVSYFASKSLSGYDAVFAPGPYVKERQLPYVGTHSQLYDIGLPVTDGISNSKDMNRSSHGIPTLLYTPSWSSDAEYISINEKLLEEIGKLKGWNVIIRPHPNLLLPGRCDGVDWEEKLEILQRRSHHVVLHAGEGTSVYDVLATADVLLTDISSVLFEFLILDRPIILSYKDGIDTFYDCEDLFGLMSEACGTIFTPVDLALVLSGEFKQPRARSCKRQELLARSIYNPGNATEKMMSALRHLAKNC